MQPCVYTPCSSSHSPAFKPIASQGVSIIPLPAKGRWHIVKDSAGTEKGQDQRQHQRATARGGRGLSSQDGHPSARAPFGGGRQGFLSPQHP